MWRRVYEVMTKIVPISYLTLLTAVLGRIGGGERCQICVRWIEIMVYWFVKVAIIGGVFDILGCSEQVDVFG